MRLGDQVQDVIESEGITPQELDQMLASAAISSQRGATRRYHQWLFEYDKKRDFLARMFKHVDGWTTDTPTLEHHACKGWGCVKCGWSGEIPCT